MSKQYSGLDRMQLWVPCPQCGAGFEVECREGTIPFRTPRRPHTARLQPLQAAWTEGYDAGRRDTERIYKRVVDV